MVRSGPAAPTVIRDLQSGAVAATLGPVYVAGFSGDHSRVVTVGTGATQSSEVIRWQTGEVVATEPILGTVVAAYQPDGPGLMVVERASVNGARELRLIPGSGPSRLIASEVEEIIPQ